MAENQNHINKSDKSILLAEISFVLIIFNLVLPITIDEQGGNRIDLKIVVLSMPVLGVISGIIGGMISYRANNLLGQGASIFGIIGNLFILIFRLYKLFYLNYGLSIDWHFVG
jgi:hypothetical protein